MPSLEQFLLPIDLLDAVSQSALKPDFVIATVSPAMLHPLAIARFAKAILSLLEARLSVHLKLCKFQDHGIPQDKTILLLIASPLYAPLPALPLSRRNTSQGPQTTLNDMIADLSIVNSRASVEPERGFVFQVQQPNEPFLPQRSRKNIFNHQTGRRPGEGAIVIDMNSTALALPSQLPLNLIHPGKVARLLV